MYSKQTETCGSFTQSPQAYCVYQYIQNDNTSIITHNEINTTVSNSLNFRDYSQQAETKAKVIYKKTSKKIKE